MCGIAGLFLKNAAWEPDLGRYLAAMTATLSERGPDSAGFAVYGDGRDGLTKVTLRRNDAATDWREFAGTLKSGFDIPVSFLPRATHAVLGVPGAAEPKLRAWLAHAWPSIDIVSVGARMEVYKDVGLPDNVAAMFDLAGMRGTHAIAHTRMATESSVTTDGAHPFTTGRDQCLVHNGSLSNHNGLRRMLRHEGLSFETENDTEVAAGYLTWRMREGNSLKDALTASLDDLDGFYTFVVGTEKGFAVLRDPIACKPAVMAETDDYVAFGSEYRALAVLPDIAMARVFEPKPATVYAWERN